VAADGDKIAEIFGTRVHRRMHGKLATIIDRIEHGHHVFRAYFKHAFLKQYEKFFTFLRNELVSNNLADFRLKKGLEHLEAVRQRFQTITARFAGFQAQWLSVRLALPITVRCGSLSRHQDPRHPHHPPPLLHGGTQLGGWTAKQIHHSVLTNFHLDADAYGLTQLRYDLRKLKGHGLLQRDGSRYAYRLTPKGVQVAAIPQVVDLLAARSFPNCSTLLVYDFSTVESIPCSRSSSSISRNSRSGGDRCQAGRRIRFAKPAKILRHALMNDEWRLDAK
jgi:hypothetical protein